MNEPEMIDEHVTNKLRWKDRKIPLEELKKDIESLEKDGINLIQFDIMYYDEEAYLDVDTYIRRSITEKEIHDREFKKQNDLIKKEEDERKLYRELKLKYKDL